MSSEAYSDNPGFTPGSKHWIVTSTNSRCGIELPKANQHGYAVLHGINPDGTKISPRVIAATEIQTKALTCGGLNFVERYNQHLQPLKKSEFQPLSGGVLVFEVIPQLTAYMINSGAKVGIITTGQYMISAMLRDNGVLLLASAFKAPWARASQQCGICTCCSGTRTVTG
jgi:hypothetical protein